ncbi:MAG TPA: globin domain-containing protein [Cyclobacteriaceae bacterium]|nr:globin domain-containing protein [Cyclobacteriaceae bacterium]
MKPDQVAILKKSFASLETVGPLAGHHFYERLFQKNPAFRLLFKNDMSLQIEKFLSTLKLIVYSFEPSADGEYRLADDLRVPLLNLGKDHEQLGVTNDMYKPTAEALLASIEKFLGSGFTPEVRKAWADAYWELAEAMNTHQ